MFFEPTFPVLVLALLLEYLLGDPRTSLHPVALFGRFCHWLESRLWSDRKAAGFIAWLMAITLPFLLILWLLHLSMESFNPLIAIIFQALLLWSTIGWKSLFEHVAAVQSSSDLEQARQKVGLIVGRKTESMSEQDIHRAAIESLAENSSDAIIAPLFWFALLGAPGAWLYRMINTLDAMWGHKSSRYLNFGWFAAKADDIANFLPARITAFLLLIQRPQLFTGSRRQQFSQQAGQHLSPNAGYPETAMAFLLEIKLGGPVLREAGTEHRAWMGDSDLPISKCHIRQAMRRTHTGCIFACLILAATLL